MDMKHLKYFVEVVRHGSFLKASSRIHVTQPGLSKAIRQLEEEFGTPLLVRGRPGVPARLTPSGELVYHHAQALLERRSQMQIDVGMLKNMVTGTLKIGLPPLGSTALIASAHNEFRRLFPRVDLQFVERGGEELVDAVLGGELEVAVSLLPRSPDLDWQFICEEPLVVVLPLNHAFAHRHSVSLQDMEGQQLVCLEGASLLNRMVREYGEKQGWEICEGARTGHLAFGLSLVASGAGIMVLPRLIAAHHATPGMMAVALDCPGLRWQLGLIWRRDAVLSAAAGNWLALVKARREDGDGSGQLPIESVRAHPPPRQNGQNPPR